MPNWRETAETFFRKRFVVHENFDPSLLIETDAVDMPSQYDIAVIILMGHINLSKDENGILEPCRQVLSSRFRVTDGSIFHDGNMEEYSLGTEQNSLRKHSKFC